MNSKDINSHVDIPRMKCFSKFNLMIGVKIEVDIASHVIRYKIQSHKSCLV